MEKKKKVGVAAHPARSGKTAAAKDVERQERIKAILDTAGKALEAEGVKYFAGAVDKRPEDPDGGKAYVQSDITGVDFCYILDLALPTNQDLINVGIYLGQVIQGRKKKPQTLKGNSN